MTDSSLSAVKGDVIADIITSTSAIVESDSGSSSTFKQMLTLAVLGVIIFATIIGNAFVIAAVLMERNLRCHVANYLVASLAVADMMVAILAMPIAAVKEVALKWVLGRVVCDVWICIDVVCCTASIWHLVAISIDRYWAVSRVDYIHNRTSKPILWMIAISWFLSFVISLPLFFLRDDIKEPTPSPAIILTQSNVTSANSVEDNCLITQNLGYTVFSTVGAFYLPLVLMICVYVKIYRVAQSRINRKRFQRVPQNDDRTVAPPLPPPKGIRHIALSSATRKGLFSDVSSKVAIQPDKIHEMTSSLNYPRQITSAGNNNHNDTSTVSIVVSNRAMPVTSAEITDVNVTDTQLVSSTADHVTVCCKQNGGICVMNQTRYDEVLGLVHATSAEMTPRYSSPEIKFETHFPYSKNGQSCHSPSTHGDAADVISLRHHSLTLFPVNAGEGLTNKQSNSAPMEAMFSLPVPVQVLERRCRSFADITRQLFHTAPAASVGDVTTTTSGSVRSRDHIAIRRERKAARTLAIITGTFILCWLPFFIVAIVRPFCGSDCSYPEWLLSVIGWLGYVNSLLNPIIYTLFNPDFRSAFSRILFGKHKTTFRQRCLYRQSR